MAAIDDPVVQATLARAQKYVRSAWLLPIVTALIAGIWIPIGMHRQHDWETHRVTSDARVIDVKQQGSSDGYVHIRVRLTWVPNGATEPVTVTKSANFVPNVGDSMKVTYDSRNAREAYVAGNQLPDHVFFPGLVTALAASAALYWGGRALRTWRWRREIIRILSAAEWRRADVESWSMGYFSQTVLVVRVHASEPVVREIRGSIGRRRSNVLMSSTIYEVAGEEKMVVRAPGAEGLVLYKPLRGREEQRYIMKLSRISPLMRESEKQA